MNNVELVSMNNVELVSMNNVELVSMNNVELASMNNVELASGQHEQTFSWALASMNDKQMPHMCSRDCYSSLIQRCLVLK